MVGFRVVRGGAAAWAIVGAALAVQSAAAQVADGEAHCYARAFSADYLSDPRNDALTLVEIALIIDARSSSDASDAHVTVRAMPRDEYGAFVANDGTCQWDEGTGRYSCDLYCGGRIDVTFGDDGTASLINVGGFSLGTICAAALTEGERHIPADDAHAAFQLFPVPVEACPVDLFGMYGDG